MPIILDLGAAEYSKIGPESSPGTVVYSLSGNVERPGNYELLLGTTMRELIYDVGGGIPNGRQLKAIIPGGSSVPAFTPDQIDTPADFDSIQAAGSFLGSAAIIVVDDRVLHGPARAARREVLHARVVREVHAVPRGDALDGQLLEKIEVGRARRMPTSICCENVCDRVEGRSLCALGDFAVWPVRATSTSSAPSSRRTSTQGGCPYGGKSSVEGVVAPIDQHTPLAVAEVPA